MANNDKNNQIPVFFASNDKYAPYLSVAMTSILYNTKSYIQFFVLDSGITKANKQILNLLHNKFNNFDIEYIEINLKEQFENFKEIHSSYSITKDMYSRLLIPELKPDINKAIYLDVDICVVNDIKELYELDLNDNSIGAIKSHYLHKIEDKQKQQFYFSLDNYFNSGVLLINCQKWRKHTASAELIKTFKEKSHLYSLYDQDLLNDYFRNDIKFIDLKFNYHSFNNPKSILVNNKLNNVVVIHYSGKIKPWSYFITTSPSTDGSIYYQWWFYAKITPFYEGLLNNFIVINDTRLYNKLIERQTNNEKIIKLFWFIPLLKIKYDNEFIKYYLFNFIPIIKIVNKNKSLFRIFDI